MYRGFTENKNVETEGKPKYAGPSTLQWLSPLQFRLHSRCKWTRWSSHLLEINRVHFIHSRQVPGAQPGVRSNLSIGPLDCPPL